METCTTFCARLQAESSRWWASTNRKSINYVENVAVFIQFCIENEEKLPCFEKEYDGTSAGKQHLFNYCDEPTTGGGGMLLTDDEELAARAKYLSTTAKEPAKWGYYHKVAGWNLRMPGVNAAIGAAQLEYFDKIIENKRETAQMYKKFFAELGIPFVTEPENSRANYWLNAIFLKDRAEREEFLEYTNSNGVQTRPIWTLMYKMPPYEHCERTDMTNSEWLEDHLVNIPSSVRTSI